MVAGACSTSFSGGWGKRIAWTPEGLKVVVSWDSAIALQTGQEESNSISKNEKQREEMLVPFDPIIPFLGYYPKEIIKNIFKKKYFMINFIYCTIIHTKANKWKQQKQLN